MTGILGAMKEEIAAYLEAMRNTETHDGPVTFYTGTLEDEAVVLVKTGIGKVNAAMTVQMMIDRFSPAQIVMTGLAGGLNPSIQQLDILLADSLYQHDVDVTAIGFKLGEIPFTGRRFATDEEITNRLELAFHDADMPEDSKLHRGVIVTGDRFINSEKERSFLQERFNGDAAEMEGAAAAQVCKVNGVPFAAIRVISDSAGEGADREFSDVLRSAPDIGLKLISNWLRGFR